MNEQATLVIIKPDAIKRGLTGAVLARLEVLGLEIIAAKAVRVSKELAERHYQHLRERSFFTELVDLMQGKLHGTSYVLAFIYWGPQAIERVREVMGATHPEKADPQSIRGAFGRMIAGGVMENILHASADPMEAAREIPLWFEAGELLRPLPYFSTSTVKGRG